MLDNTIIMCHITHSRQSPIDLALKAIDRPQPIKQHRMMPIPLPGVLNNTYSK